MIESFMTIWTPSVSSNSVLKRLFPFMRSLSFYINLINTTYCFWNSLCLVLRCISLSFLSENLEEIKFFHQYFAQLQHCKLSEKDNKIEAWGFSKPQLSVFILGSNG